jgi:hypothetical protein
MRGHISEVCILSHMYKVFCKWDCYYVCNIQFKSKCEENVITAE